MLLSTPLLANKCLLSQAACPRCYDGRIIVELHLFAKSSVVILSCSLRGAHCSYQEVLSFPKAKRDCEER